MTRRTDSSDQSDAFDLAIQEAVRATTPKRRPIKLVKKKSERPKPQPLSIEQVLAWADAHHASTGVWPKADSGPISGDESEKWSRIHAALREGRRGLPGGTSLGRLLAEQRGVRHLHMLPDITIAIVLQWADSHHFRTGDWPHYNSGAILDTPGETWGAIQAALVIGYRSLPGGITLASLLADHRGVRNRKRLPHLTKELILTWADAYRERYGKWPKHNSGPIEGTHGETWTAVAVALYAGQRGLPGDTSLPRLLAEYRGVSSSSADENTVITRPLHTPARRPSPEVYTESQILVRADAWHLQYGRWPRINSGPIYEGAVISWSNIDGALRLGSYGLPGGSSLARLLATQRSVPNRSALPVLTPELILERADLHKERTGRWPTKGSGSIKDAPDETWSSADVSLRYGGRGLAGGSSLAILLTAARGRRNCKRTPPLSETQILLWADTYHTQTGKWPKKSSGSILGEPDETWSGVSAALTVGGRSLAGGSSLAQLLFTERGVPKGRHNIP